MNIESIECFLGCDGLPLAKLLNDPKLDDDPRFPRCGTSVYPDGEHPLCDLETCEIYFITAAMIATAADELDIAEPSKPEEFVPFCDEIVNYYVEKDYHEGLIPPCPNTGARRWLKGSSYIPHYAPSFYEKLHHGLLMKRLDVLHFFRKTRWQISNLVDSLSR